MYDILLMFFGFFQFTIIIIIIIIFIIEIKNVDHACGTCFILCAKFMLNFILLSVGLIDFGAERVLQNSYFRPILDVKSFKPPQVSCMTYFYRKNVF